MSVNNKEEDYSLEWQPAIEDRLDRNRQVYDIVIQLKKEAQTELSLKELKQFIDYLIDEKNYTIEDIKSGKASEELDDLIFNREMYLHSVEIAQKRDIYPLLLKREEILKKVVSVALTAALSISAIGLTFAGINHLIKKNDLSKEASLNLGRITAMALEDTNLGIADQCKKLVGDDITKNAYTYDIDLMAEKVTKICRMNPELFDVTIANIYFEMDFARLYNMDRLFSKLEASFQNEESLSRIAEDLANYEIFLDYLISKGLISEDHNKYQDILAAIERYKQLKPYNLGYTFDVLNDTEQFNLEFYLIGSYKEFRDDQNYQYGIQIDDIADNILEEGVGGRPSGS